MKKFFEEPEIEVVRFNAKDLIIMTSGCTGDVCTGDDYTDEPGGCANGDTCEDAGDE